MNVPGWDVALHGLCLKPAGLKKMTFLSPNLCFFFSNQLKQPLRSLVESNENMGAVSGVTLVMEIL